VYVLVRRLVKDWADVERLSQKIRRSGFLFGSAGRETRHSRAKLLSGLAFRPLTADFMPNPTYDSLADFPLQAAYETASGRTPRTERRVIRLYALGI
jgi:hypothetical protein